MGSSRGRNTVSPRKSIQRVLIHLRLAFSLVLTPLFLWGCIARPGPIAWGHVLAAYLIIHFIWAAGLVLDDRNGVVVNIIVGVVEAMIGGLLFGGPTINQS